MKNYSLFSIDNYTDAKEYNNAKIALFNNNVSFSEMILTRAPYSWYFQTHEGVLPIMMNYDLISPGMQKFLVTKVKPLNFNDEIKLYRRGGQQLNDAIGFINNDALEAATGSDYACFFNSKSRQQLIEMSKNYPGKIYFLGKYFNNKYRVCLATNEMIKSVIDIDDILLEKETKTKAGHFEAEFNHKVLKLKEYLIKFAKSPFAKDGKYHEPKIQGERAYTNKYIL